MTEVRDEMSFYGVFSLDVKDLLGTLIVGTCRYLVKTEESKGVQGRISYGGNY